MSHWTDAVILSLGAFVAAPVGAILWAAGAFCLRIGVQYLMARKSGKPFTALDRPIARETEHDTDESSVEVVEQPWTYQDGKFF